MLLVGAGVVAAACGGGGSGDDESSAADVGAALGQAAAESADPTDSTGAPDPSQGTDPTEEEPDPTEAPTSPSTEPSTGSTDPTDPGEGATPAQVDLAVTDIAAPTAAPEGVDACGTPVGFDVANLVDGEEDTAWRTPGDASGQSLTLTLDGEHDVQSVGLVPGYAKTDPCDGTDRFAQNRRPTTVTWVFDDGTEVSQDLVDQPEGQTVAVDASTHTIELRIDAVTGPPERDFTAVSEITVQGT